MPINFSQHPGLIAYLTAGDPDLATTLNLALALLDNGADVLELGVPFSDPLAPALSPTDILLVNLSGRGDKDMGILARELHLNGAQPTHAENRGTR